jgi:hypothetical protein
MNEGVRLRTYANAATYRVQRLMRGILRDEIGEDSEFQAKGLKPLQENQKVSFDVKQGPRVSRRPNIQLI